MGRLSGGKPRKTCSSTVFGNRCSGLTPREGFRNECARQRCDGLKDAVCATRVMFKGTGTIWLRCHRSRRQIGRLQMLPLTVPGQLLEISLEWLGQPMPLYVPLSK